MNNFSLLLLKLELLGFYVILNQYSVFLAPMYMPKMEYIEDEQTKPPYSFGETPIIPHPSSPWQQYAPSHDVLFQ